MGVDLGDERRAASHRHRQGLGAAHPAESRRDGELPGEGAVGRAEVASARLGERLVRPLEDPLRPDVDPGAGRHLAVHRQPERLEAPELVPGPPVRHEVRVRDQDARRVGMRAEDGHGLARLDEERLLVAEALELAEDRLEALGVARGFTGAAVDDEVLAALGHVGGEVVQEHPVGRFREPGAAPERRPAREGRRGVAGGGGDGAHAADVSPEGAPSAGPQAARGPRRAGDLTSITQRVILSGQ